ncbi:hypothetical protein K1T71_002240 [Dendrolimus kikuchii]|uniref:Uncharacterized protein n=1 Tax=Dendrolimus kikuchii TaxID=765133 RepID=A0ACC1DC49_9NEOP|nr:hypothetical protein K1T71_002240 [Dendrolimus kikuchii]
MAVAGEIALRTCVAMKLHAPARVIQRIAQGTPVRLTSGGCAQRPTPVCPPYAPKAQPECRARAQQEARALRVVCCPPARSRRPPCPDPVPEPPLTCDRANITRPVARVGCELHDDNETASIREGGCGEENDRVARRLAAAELARRRDYEREVAAEEAAPRPAAPAATYSPGTERECAVATDARQYTVQPTRAGERVHCGAGRRPPAPRCVTLTPDRGCQIYDGSRVDPCAHRPRVLLEVDRRGDDSLPDPRSENRRTLAALTSVTGSHPVGVQNWCNDPPKRITEPVRCRPQTLVERLRSRATVSKKPPSGRNLHTSTAHLRVSEKSNGGKCTPTGDDKKTGTTADVVTTIMSDRSRLKEAGQGRVVPRPGRPRSTSGGRLDLDIPEGARRVTVAVSLERTAEGFAGDANYRPVSTLATMSTSEAGGRRDSWLSIEEIKKKISGCRRKDDTCDSRENKEVNKPTKTKGPPSPTPKGDVKKTQESGRCPAPKSPTPRPFPTRTLAVDADA